MSNEKFDIEERFQIIEHFIKNQIVVKDEQIDKLYKELESYKQDAADRFVNQLMKSVIKIRKNLKRVMESEEWNSLTADELRREYTYIFEDLTDLLNEQNVDEIITEVGEEFDPSIHQAKIEITNEVKQDKRVKQSLSEGYVRSNKTLIAERIIAYQYKEE